MGWIPRLFADKVRALAAGDSLPVGGEPGEMIRDTVFFDLLEAAVTAPGGRAIPMRVGASMRCDEYGAFGLAFKSAVDLGGSYRRVVRYGRVVTSVANFVLTEGPETWLEVVPGPVDRLGLRLTSELALAAAVALSREVGTEPFAPLAVDLSLDRPADPTPFQDHFGCPLRFGARRDALRVSDAGLAASNRLGDASISKFFDAHLERALGTLPTRSELPQRAKLATEPELVRRVREAVARALPEGVPSLDAMASRMAMSRRTLQRRLEDADVRYQALVADVRQGIARELLERSAYGLAEIAFLTGFSDQSTFTRAFKRWSGETPRSYRSARSA